MTIFTECGLSRAKRNINWARHATSLTGNRLKGSGNQSTFEGAVTEWAKLSWTATSGRYTDTRDRRAHYHESRCHRTFFRIFDETAVPVDYIRGFCSVAVLYALHGERPPAILRDAVALCQLSQIIRETW